MLTTLRAEFLWANDFTKISFVIMGLFVFGSAMVGYKVFSYTRDEELGFRYESEWLLSEHLMSLGLLGTFCLPLSISLSET